MNCVSDQPQMLHSETSYEQMTLPPTVVTAPSNERPPFYPRKVLRFPALKRNRDSAPLNERVKLERVLGFTISGNASLRCDPNTGSVIYPAGCAIVLYNARKNKQSHILNTSKKTITSLDISADGKYIVSGECGHLPNVRVWDVQEKVQVAEFTGHKYGINCVAFSPNLKYVVSVGSQHDMIVNVWDWRSGVKVASNKVSSKVKAVAFAEGGNYFVTVGNRHVKFWYLECSARPSKYKEPVPLMGRSAILGEKRNNYFCDVSCGVGDIASSTFSITKSGLLCEFNSRRLLDKWVELRTQSANCLTVGRSLIFIGCTDGIVRCFNPYTLEFVTTLPRTHYLGVDVSMGLSISHMAAPSDNAKYPDTIAIAYDESNSKVTCIYGDHSMYIWDVKDIKKVGKSHSFLYHSACIWGIEVYPPMLDSQKPSLPSGSFITCSSDDTIRIWNFDSAMPNNTAYRKNIYCNELLKIVYVDEGLSYLCDLDHNPGGSNDKMDATYDTKNGVRCIRIAPDGHHLASGDRSGNIRIHDLQRMDEVCKIEAHDSEVLNLEYSKPDTGHRFLASASRDRLIHVFDVDKDYAFQQTLDDHSSSITAVRFVQSNNQLQMISCGADKSIIFRTAQCTPQLQFNRDHHVVGKTTLYDMEVDFDQKHILTACQDRHVRVYSVGSGKHSKSFKGSLGEDGTLIKVVLDSSGLFAATSCTDKNLCVYDFSSGECVATMFGHSELVTGLRFTNDCKHLISVSGDGCIFIWKLPLEITHQMQVRLAQVAPKMKLAFRKSSPNRLIRSTDANANEGSGFGPAHTDVFDAAAIDSNDEGIMDYRLSIGPLPKWAKKEIASDFVTSPTTEKTVSIAQPKGRWAQRIDTQGLVVRSFYSSDHVIPYPGQVLGGQGVPMAIENAQETEYRKYTDIRRETIVIAKQQTDNPTDFVPCPESLHDIRFGSMQGFDRSPTSVSNKRGMDLPFITSRRRLVTDSSSTSSVVQVEDLDMEQDHDGDAEDEESIETDHSAELDGEIIYYPQPDLPLDTDEGDFKVRATNPDELRDAHRRLRKGKAERPSDLPLVMVHDSDDDDEAGTPQDPNRNILSMFNVSMESLDRVGQREKFMKSTYESLDGESAIGKEEEGSSTTTGIGSSVTDDGEQSEDHRQSLSARYLYQSNSTTPLRNVAVMNASKHKNEASSPKRQEIMRQIENTRRKLDTIGFKASRNSSKSIGDLTDLPEKDYPGGRYFSYSKDSSEQDSIRRASSMNDLSKPRRLLPPPPTDVSSSKSASPRPYAQTRDANPSRLPSSMARSTSMGTLNPNESDSDAPANSSTQKASTLSRWSTGSSMRPTISSMNKAIGGRGSQEHVNGSSGRTTPAFRSPGSKQGTISIRRSGEPMERRKNQAVAIDTRRSVTPASETSSGETSPVDTRPPPRGALGASNQTLTLPRNHGRSNAASHSSLALASSRSRSERDLTKVDSNDMMTATAAAARTKHDSSTRRTLVPSMVPPVRGQRSSVVNGGMSLSSSKDGHMLEKSPQELPVKDNLPQPIDVTSAHLSRELCDATAQGLKQSADNMLQLYKRVAMESDLQEADRVEMMNILHESTTQAQQTLRPINPTAGFLSAQINSLGSQTKSMSPLPWKVPGTTTGSTGGGGTGSLQSQLFMDPARPSPAPDQMQLLQQYSDMLLNLVQQRMGPQS